MKITRSPATIFDMADLSGAMIRLHWQIAKEMWHAGDAFAFRAGDALVALGGFYPLDADATDAEAWFCPGPGAAPHMPGLVRAFRLTLSETPYRSIVTLCATEAGRRIARLLGFRRAAATEMGEVWVYGELDQRAFRRQSGPAAEGRAGEPAAQSGAAGSPAG